ncbi:hypothetical protein EDD16DRAFT_1514948 [Pisolithus croceorrhizus]|nr:hypothetical protein EV401DRAFT_1893907 [Pisolithus croceorrhizus]KAI6132263.1 hypothetical protein EDD16DRAFT_1514948 [Pisolithus croceorrhizus]KAI6162426.1 hypothetical protein EDD17DRAFT_1507893 [Pisolithus thermaeus]
MSLSGCSQSALTGLNDSDAEDNDNQSGFQSTLSSRAQGSGLDENTILEANEPKQVKKNVPPELLTYEKEIFGLPKAHFTPSFAQLEIPEIVQMLGVKDKPFMNWEPLRQILKAALWGKASLAKGFMQHGRPKMNGCKGSRGRHTIK